MMPHWATPSDYTFWRPHFIAMLDPELYTPEWLDCELFSGRFRLLVGAQAAILLSIRLYPTGLKEVEGQAASGKLSEIVGDLIPSAEHWARSIRCRTALIQSREGWVRTMKQHGYRLHQSSIRKVL